jgi:citronellol/citronellal dehydrogenase
MNIRDETSVNDAIQSIVSKYGKLTHVVNSAGGQFLTPASHISLKGWKAVVDTNLNGTWTVCKAAFDHYMQEHGGTIVNIVVIMQHGFPMMAHSGAARAGVENMTKSLAVEWGPYGIRMNCVAPGTVIGNGMNNYPADVHQQVIGEYEAKNPLRRLGVEGEISAAVVFLLSPGASFVTGDCMRVDGGNILWSGHMPSFDATTRVPAYTGYDASAGSFAFGETIPPIFESAYRKYTAKL